MTPRENPFRADCVVALSFRFQSENARALWKKLESQNGRGAIVGPCGTGKTTFLEGFARDLERRDFQVARLRFCDENRRLPHDFAASFSRKIARGNARKTAILVDGWEQLSAFEAWRLRRAARRFSVVVATSHRAVKGLPMWFRTETSPTLLRELCDELGAPISGEKARHLWQKHGGNLRSALRELYDERAGFSGAAEISP